MDYFGLESSYADITSEKSTHSEMPQLLANPMCMQKWPALHEVFAEIMWRALGVGGGGKKLYFALEKTSINYSYHPLVNIIKSLVLRRLQR